MCDVDGESHIIAKNIKAESLSHTDFLKLYNGINLDTAVKRQSKAYGGYVTIEDKGIVNNSNSFTKRDKVYNVDNLWTDTKPLFINTIDYHLIVYKPKALIVYNKNIIRFSQDKWYYIIKQSKLDKDALVILIIAGFIMPISFIGYLFVQVEQLEEKDFCSESSSLDIEISDNNYRDKSDITGKPDLNKGIDNNINVDKNAQISLHDDNYNVSSKGDLDILGVTIDKNIRKPEKSLYEGFEEELSKIRNRNNKTEDTRTEGSVTDESKGSLLSPTETTHDTSSSEVSPNKSKFPDTTLESINEKINRKKANLEDIDRIFKDPDLKDSVEENLFKQRLNLISEKQQYLARILNEHSENPTKHNNIMLWYSNFWNV